MSANINSIAWVQERGVPWHKLGTAVNGLMTSSEAIVAGKLDWNVECRPIYTIGANSTQVLVPNKYATVRSDTNVPLGVVGKAYVPIQNRDAFNFFDSVIGSYNAKYEVVGSLGQGENVWMLVQLGDVIRIKNTDDVVKRYILLANNHDGSRCFKMFITPIRVVCWNTLSCAMSGSKTDVLGNKNDGINIRHTVNAAERVQDARQVLGLASQFYDKIADAFQALATKEVSDKWVKDYVNQLIPRPPKARKTSSRILNVRGNIVDLMDHETNRLSRISGTAWAAYNAATLYADHFTKTSRESERINTARRLVRPSDRRLNNIWFGNAANFKVRALNLALEMVK